MSEGIAIALIGLTGSLVGSLIGVIAASKLTQYRLEQLEKKVDKHNNVIERIIGSMISKGSINRIKEERICRIVSRAKWSG